MQAIGLLLMSLSGLGLLGGTALFLYARRAGRPALAQHLGMFGLGWAALYLVVLLATSLTSHETVLEPKDRKTFCGFYLDCHLGVSVAAVERVPYIEGEGAMVKAKGIFHLVTITISSDAAQTALSLENPRALLIDTAGQTYARSLEAERALAAQAQRPFTLTRSITAGETLTQTLVFDVPATVTTPKLLFTQGTTLERFIELFLIGDEDSLFHSKTVFEV